MTGHSGDPSRTDDQNGLTPIPRRIHCAATEDASEGTDIEAIQRKEFVRVLAEIAMAISKRQGKQ